MSAPIDKTRIGRWRARQRSAISNLRPAPTWFTPELVKRVLDVIATPPALPAPVHPVPVPAAKPTLRVVADEFAPPPGERTRSGEDGVKEEAGARIPLVVDGRARVATETASSTHSSPRSKFNSTMVEKARQFALQRTEPAKPADPKKPATASKPTPWYEVPEYLEAITIANLRGIAVIDLANALNKPAATLLQRLIKTGFSFGKRPPLAEPLTLKLLLTLGDEGVPLPELRRDRLYRVRLEREAKLRRERRLVARANDPAFRPLGKRNTPGVSGTARKAPGAAELTAAKRDLISTPLFASLSTSAAQPARAPTFDPTRLVAVLPSNPLAYAGAIADARRYLESRHCTVQKVDREALIASWTVTGFSGSFSNAELVQLASDIQARASA